MIEGMALECCYTNRGVAFPDAGGLIIRYECNNHTYTHARTHEAWRKCAGIIDPHPAPIVEFQSA